VINETVQFGNDFASNMQFMYRFH